MADPIPISAARAGGSPGTRRGPARLAVYAALRDAIVRAELAPGARLSENELAERLGVSRTPIREALGRLRDDRLVEVRPPARHLRRADQPRPPSATPSSSARRSSAPPCAPPPELADDEAIAALEENLRAQERASRRSDIDAWQLLDDAFHRADLRPERAPGGVGGQRAGQVATSTGCAGSASRCPTTCRRWSRSTARSPTRSAHHDPDAAEAALRHHLRMVLREVPRIREEHPDYFEEPRWR